MKLLHVLSERRSRRFARRDRGAVLLVAVPAMALCIVSAAFGVDIGRIVVDKRFDQKVADMAALDAARAVGLILNTTNQAGYDAAAQTAAVASASRNGYTVGVNGRTITAQVGTISPATNAFSPGGTSAVQVTTTSHVDNAFLPGGKDLTARAVAYVGSPIAAFSVGSTLASIDTSKSRLDPMLKTMLGANGNLTLVSYDGLAGANLSLSRWQRAALDLGLDVGTVEDLLTTDITMGQFLQATASALTSDGQNFAAAEVQDLINTGITSSTTLKLGNLLNVASPSDSAVLDATFNVYQMIVGGAQIMNGANFVSVPLTGVNLLGLTGVTVSAYVIEPAKTAIGPVGTTANNAQVRLKVTVNVPLGFLLPTAAVELDYTTADANATLAAIVCGGSPSVGITANTSAVAVTGTATVPLGTMNIAATIAASPDTALTFSHPTEFAPTTTKHVGAAGSGVSTGSVTVTAGGAISALGPVLQLTLPTVLATLDTALQPAIKPLLQRLGVSVAQADVAALGIYPDAAACGGTPRLAQ